MKTVNVSKLMELCWVFWVPCILDPESANFKNNPRKNLKLINS